MPIPTFTPGYPPDGSSLGQTKATIRNNLDGTFQTVAIDHIDNNGQPGSQPAGYHKVIHSVPQGSDPVAIPGYGQLYSKTVNSFTSDQALFWETGGGLIQQLTTNLTPTAATNGKSFLPGGLIIQWGSGAGVSDGTSVTFNVTFPTTLFSLTIAHSASGAGENTGAIVSAASKTTAGFTLRVNGSSAASYSYVAIGN